jgi:hypothetical protein
MLEAVRVAHALLPCEPQPDQVFGRLDEDRHLVAVVLAAVVEAVHGRADGGPQDRALLDELESRHLGLLSARHRADSNRRVARCRRVPILLGHGVRALRRRLKQQAR